MFTIIGAGKEPFDGYHAMELECHASLSNCCSVFCDIANAEMSWIGRATLYFDSVSS